MPILVTWSEIAIRLACAIAAGGLIGLNRSEHGRAVGRRTSILVSLAACVAMVQVNLLLPLAGRSPSSFVMNDLMRLPLGILSGMGFIGAGAIVRRGNFVVGVTTAATMWFLTVLGLCFGGGEVVLGLTGTALGMLVLAGLKAVEDRLRRDLEGTLLVLATATGPDESRIREILENGGLHISSCGLALARDTASREYTCQLRWRVAPSDSTIPDAVRRLMGQEGTLRIAWTPQIR